MEDNGTYHWAGNPSPKPKKKPDVKKFGKTAILVLVVLLLVSLAGMKGSAALRTHYGCSTSENTLGWQVLPSRSASTCSISSTGPPAPAPETA